jgi:CRISPR-associated protein Cmr2
MTENIYTIITFAPVQGFIEKSRKLRDLYGSSLLLSFLACALCKKAQEIGCYVISPALINVSKGTPNQIIIEGDFPQELAKNTLLDVWKTLVKICRQEIEQRAKYSSNSKEIITYTWKSEWEDIANHCWEFFWTQGKITDVTPEEETIITHIRRKLNQLKYSRDWTGINWQGESSTLSGSEAIAFPRMGEHSYLPQASVAKPNHQTQLEGNSHQSSPLTLADQAALIKDFYQTLSKVFSEAIIDPDERLSIAELIKRLVTVKDIAQKITEATEIPLEFPSSFVEINRFENQLWTGWFQGDGDKIGEYLRQLRAKAQGRDINEAEKEIIHNFSYAMMDWGERLLADSEQRLKGTKNGQEYDIGRIVYAGGDDFFGVLYSPEQNSKLTAQECVEWFYQFPELWQRHKQEISVSIGLVWTAPGVPQRDIIQHCRETERLAKNQGRDRLAIRILFNGGNYLDWHCPWWCLKEILEAYKDREGDTIHTLKNKPNSPKKVPNWTHFYNDVATLEARHAFQGNENVALGLLEIYFPDKSELLTKYSWDTDKKTGILGNKRYEQETQNIYILNQWVINLAKVGFHLFS